jgi:hypothetical protein
MVHMYHGTRNKATCFLVSLDRGRSGGPNAVTTLRIMTIDPTEAAFVYAIPLTIFGGHFPARLLAVAGRANLWQTRQFERRDGRAQTLAL